MSKHDVYKVGCARADITPALDRVVYLAGFAPDRKATGILHPLEANAIYLADGDGNDCALVSLDLIGFLAPQVEELRARVAETIGHDRLVVCSTHTHSGPDTIGIWGKALFGMIPYRSGVDTAYLEMVIQRAADAVRRAKEDASACTLSAVTFDTPDGWVRNDRKGGGSYRRAVALVVRKADGGSGQAARSGSAQAPPSDAMQRPGGAIKALVLNFAAHPETLWERNQDVSPDYPGPFRDRLRELGVEHPMFFSGPLGAMLTPNVPVKSDLQTRRDFIVDLGDRLARMALDKATEAVPLSGPLRFAVLELTLLNSNKRFEIAFKRGLIKRNGADPGRISTRMASGAIGSFRFVTVPGEAAPELGSQVYDVLVGTEVPATVPAPAKWGGDCVERGSREGGGGSLRHGMILCLGMDELGYMLPPEFFSDKEYKYERSMSVGPHTAAGVLATAGRLVELVGSR